MSRSVLFFLDDIAERCTLISKWLHGKSFEDFSEDRMLSEAVIRCLEVIGEAVKGIPTDVRARHAQVPWRDIAGMRDVLIHAYFGLELEAVWEAAHDEIPVVLDLLRLVIAEEQRRG